MRNNEQNLLGYIERCKIAREKVIPSMLKAQHVEVIAVASREITKAKELADNLGISKAYGCYEGFWGLKQGLSG